MYVYVIIIKEEDRKLRGSQDREELEGTGRGGNDANTILMYGVLKKKNIKKMKTQKDKREFTQNLNSRKEVNKGFETCTWG